MTDFTAAYTELVDKVFRDGVIAAGLSAAATGEHDHHSHHHDQPGHEHHDGDGGVTAGILADGVLKHATGGGGGSGLSDVVIAKATAMTVLFVAALCAGLIPFKLAQWFKWKQGGTETGRTGLIVSLLLAFGGGVLLCTTFLHLLPEVKENVERLQASGELPRVGFHLAEFLMCVGFFTMYFIEQCVHSYLHARDERRQRTETTASAFRRGLSVRESSSVTAAATTAAAAARRKKLNDQRNGSISIAELIENDANDSGGSGSGSGGNATGKYILATVEIRPKSDGITAQPHHHAHGHAHAHRHGHSHLHLPVAADKTAGGDASSGGDEDAVATSLRGLLIVLALSVHELFEGLAVGLEGSAANVWYLFGAVAAHKLVLAFCVGVELIVSRTRPWLAFVYVLTFSVVSPIGIGIGILVSSHVDGGGAAGGDGGGMVSVLLQGLASGTLLYVVFFEILQKDKSGLLQLVAVLVGFFIMFGLQFICEYIVRSISMSSTSVV